jgi:TPR repeat protein
VGPEFGADLKRPVGLAAVHAGRSGFGIDERLGFDLVTAANSYELPADQNYTEAQFSYAICRRRRGDGVAVDLVNSAKYYKLAADQNHAEAQFNYANCLRQGRGVAVDLVNSAKYYKLAADQSLAFAGASGPEALRCVKGALMNQTGHGIER